MRDFIGNFKLNDTLYAHFMLRNELGDPISSDWAGPPSTILYYDILMPDGSSTGATKLYEDQTLSEYADPTGDITDLWVADTGIALTTANGFVEGRTYIVVLKDLQSAPNNLMTKTFVIDTQASILGDTQLILDVETTDGISAAAPNSVLGRLRTLELNQLQNLSPKLRRILGMLGENCLVDGYFHDDAGNITTARMRVFDTTANLSAATPWSDTENFADPASALETGEKARYNLTITHLLPRNLRTLYNDQISTNAADQAYDETSVL